MTEGGKARIILALDGLSAEEALEKAKSLKDSVGIYKIGLEQIYGSLRKNENLLSRLRAFNRPLFLDAKLYDIPNTIKGAVRNIAALGADFLTTHHSAVNAARDAVGDGGAKILAITILTSDQADEEEVLALAEKAKKDGADGVIASAQEARALRESLGKDFLIITPGIRPSFYKEKDDQKRRATPADAIKAGADYLVIGRPILRAKNPRQAAKEIAEEIESAR